MNTISSSGSQASIPVSAAVPLVSESTPQSPDYSQEFLCILREAIETRDFSQLQHILLSWAHSEEDLDNALYAAETQGLMYPYINTVLQNFLNQRQVKIAIDAALTTRNADHISNVCWRMGEKKVSEIISSHLLMNNRYHNLLIGSVGALWWCTFITKIKEIENIIKEINSKIVIFHFDLKNLLEKYNECFYDILVQVENCPNNEMHQQAIKEMTALFPADSYIFCSFGEDAINKIIIIRNCILSQVRALHEINTKLTGGWCTISPQRWTFGTMQGSIKIYEKNWRSITEAIENMGALSFLKTHRAFTNSQEMAEQELAEARYPGILSIQQIKALCAQITDDEGAGELTDAEIWGRDTQVGTWYLQHPYGGLCLYRYTVNGLNTEQSVLCEHDGIRRLLQDIANCRKIPSFEEACIAGDYTAAVKRLAWQKRNNPGYTPFAMLESLKAAHAGNASIAAFIERIEVIWNYAALLFPVITRTYSLKNADSILQGLSREERELVIALATRWNTATYFAFYARDTATKKQRFEHILQRNPNDVCALRCLGNVLRQQDNLEGAKQCLGQALALEPNDVFTLARLGDVLRQQGNLEAAKQHLERALALAPNDDFTLAILGDVLREQNCDLETAKLYLERALVITPDDVFTLSCLGEVLRLQGNLEAAEQRFKEVLAIVPGAVCTLARLGHALLQQGNLEDAKQRFERALALEPDRALALAGLGDVLRQQGNFEGAKQRLEQALTLKPNDVFTVARLGEVLRHQGNLEGAKQHFEQALTTKPNDVFALARLGDVLRRQGNYETARQRLEQALALQPNDAFIVSRLGEVLRRQDNYGAAKQRFEQALALKPNDAFTLSGLGDVLRMQGNFEVAKQHLEQALAIEPNNTFILQILGDVLGQQGNYEAAKQRFEQALALEPNNAFALSHLGDDLRRQGNLEGAKQRLEQALALEPNDAFIVSRLGDVLRQQGNYEAAKQRLERALALEPNNVLALSCLGDVLRQQGNFEGAKQRFEQALDINPNNVFILARLGEVLRQQGNYEAAKQSLERALALEPDDAFVVSCLGEVLRQQGNYEAAKERLEQALALEPDDVFVVSRLGEVFRQQGNLEAAKQRLEQALAIKPNDVFILARLGDVLRQQGNLEGSKQHFEQAFALEPNAVRGLLRETFKTEEHHIIRLDEIMATLVPIVSQRDAAVTQYTQTIRDTEQQIQEVETLVNLLTAHRLDALAPEQAMTQQIIDRKNGELRTLQDALALAKVAKMTSQERIQSLNPQYVALYQQIGSYRAQMSSELYRRYFEYDKQIFSESAALCAQSERLVTAYRTQNVRGLHPRPSSLVTQKQFLFELACMICNDPENTTPNSFIMLETLEVCIQKMVFREISTTVAAVRIEKSNVENFSLFLQIIQSDNRLSLENRQVFEKEVTLFRNLKIEIDKYLRHVKKQDEFLPEYHLLQRAVSKKQNKIEQEENRIANAQRDGTVIAPNVLEALNKDKADLIHEEMRLKAKKAAIYHSSREIQGTGDRIRKIIEDAHLRDLDYYYPYLKEYIGEDATDKQLLQQLLINTRYRITDEHYRQARSMGDIPPLPASCRPREEFGPRLRALFLKVYNEQDSRAALQKLADYIRWVSTRVARQATPPAADSAALERFYQNIETPIMHTLIHVEQLESTANALSNSERTEALRLLKMKQTQIINTILAGADFCGARQAIDALNVYQQHVLAIHGDFVSLVHQNLQTIREVIVRTCAEFEDRGNTHYYAALVQVLGEKFAIPGWRALQSYRDLFASEIVAADAESSFERAYTPYTIFSSLYAELGSTMSEELRNQFMQYCYELLPAEWGRQLPEVMELEEAKQKALQMKAEGKTFEEVKQYLKAFVRIEEGDTIDSLIAKIDPAILGVRRAEYLAREVFVSDPRTWTENDPRKWKIQDAFKESAVLAILMRSGELSKNS